MTLQISAKPLQDDIKSDTILISRRDLEMEHRQLLARLHRLRQLLGYPPLLTHKKRQEAEAA